MPRQWTHVETAQLDIHSLKVALCFVMNKVELSSWKSYRSQQLIGLGGGAACAGRVSGPQQIHFLGKQCTFGKPYVSCFPRLDSSHTDNQSSGPAQDVSLLAFQFRPSVTCQTAIYIKPLLCT